MHRYLRLSVVRVSDIYERTPACILATSKGNELNGREIIGWSSGTRCFEQYAKIIDPRDRAVCASWPGGTRNFLTFVNTTAIACHQNPEALVDFLPVCNSSRVYKRQKITSTVSAVECAAGNTPIASPAKT